MSKADILVVKNQQKKVQSLIKEVIKEGTSKGNNREIYQNLRARANRLDRWLNDLLNLEKNKKK